MKWKKDKILTLFGIMLLVYWSIDFFHNAVIPHDYSWLLWYSSAGLLLTGIAFIIQNSKLIYSLFCALFVIEILWLVDLLSTFFRHQTVVGLTAYFFSPSFHPTDVYFTLYHILIPIGLLIAVRRLKKPYQYGWFGAAIFATMLATLTYFLTDQKSQVNCIHSLNQCHTLFAFLYRIDNPYRIIIAILGLTIFVFIPTNYLLLYFKKKTTLNTPTSYVLTR